VTDYMIASTGMTMIGDKHLASVTSKFEFKMKAERQNEISQLSASHYTVVVVLRRSLET
jgi:hypothetical protein